MHWVAPSENDTATALGKRFLDSRIGRAHSIFRETPVPKPLQVETAAELDIWLPCIMGEWSTSRKFLLAL